MSLATVQSRIAELQSRMGTRPPVLYATDGTGDGTGSGIAAATDSTTGSSFSSLLDSITNGGTAALDGSTNSYALDGTGSGVTGDAVIKDATRYLGVPYVWGGTDPAKGLDCSGFVQRVFKDMGIALPRVSRDQAKQGAPVASLDAAKPGDLVAFGSPVDHIGIYAGNGKMIVAPHTGASVRFETVDEGRITAIRRVLPSNASTGALDPAALLARTASSGASTTTKVSEHPAHTIEGLGGPYAELYRKAGAKYGIDPLVLAAIGWEESRQTPTAVSSKGALGVMQLMPATARSLGVDPTDPAQAIDGAARLLSSHLQRFKNLDLALAAYGAGAGAVVKYGGVPPYKETTNYIAKIHELIAPEAA